MIRTVGERLVIAGGPLRGNMYGVYGFLEDHLGCRWFAPGVSRIPKSPRLAIGPIDDRQVPALEYREPYVDECFDGDWCARNRMNSSIARLEEKHGGKVKFCRRLAHTFSVARAAGEVLQRASRVFLAGQRPAAWTDTPQLCCTNPDVIRICTEAIRELMRRQPEARCFPCRRTIATTIASARTARSWPSRKTRRWGRCCNWSIAWPRAWRRSFPTRSWRRWPTSGPGIRPSTMRPRPNVVIRLCSIECCFSHPLATCDSEANKAFRADIEAWAKIAPRLWVWDYTTDFANYLLPFPNQRVLGPNIRFFVAHNVKGIFEEDTYDTPTANLRRWADTSWPSASGIPNYDANRAINEFLDGYYGKAAAPIRAYIDLLHDHVERENIHVGIYAGTDTRT